MEHSNECKRNFVAVYDGSSSIENLKAKFCSTVANDVMLQTGTGVVRMWADEGSRLSRFRMLFTSFVDRKYILKCLFWYHGTSGTLEKAISYVLCSRNLYCFLHIQVGKLNTCFITVMSMVPEERLSSFLKRFIFPLNSRIIQP